ncbi:MAG: tRNA pseudouridine(38-40) synthase TruA [Lachnospirales bacterium]
MNYKIVLEYEGTRYNGWQRQVSTPNTIQGIIEDAIKTVTGENVEINGSGRTDAGTHALGQVANFKLSNKYDNLMDKINDELPSDIRILSCCEVDDRFHARLNAIGKVYYYKIDTGKKVNVFTRRTVNHFNFPLNIEEMKRASKMLVGTYDFKSFCSNKRTKKSTVRTIYSIDILQNGTEITFVYNGNGFLYNMVRILTGTLLEVGFGKISADDIPSIIEARDRSRAGMTMPPRGLTLAEVKYKEDN